jgi:hypothetical protein
VQSIVAGAVGVHAAFARSTATNGAVDNASAAANRRNNLFAPSPFIPQLPSRASRVRVSLRCIRCDEFTQCTCVLFIHAGRAAPGMSVARFGASQ